MKKERCDLSCMEHRCLSCGYVTFNNNAHSPGSCPSCGGEMSHYFDEPDEREDERDEDDRGEFASAMRVD
jgi:predicted  nucleic acid-binding Zn-ribbon protein